MADALFAGTLAEVKAKLRMDGATDAGSLAVFGESLLAARTFFWRRLGLSRITTIQAAALTDSPATDAQYLRAVAANCEVRVLMLELIQRLPVFLGDATPGALRAWNEEGFLRDVAGDTLQQKIDALNAQIAADLDILVGDEAPGAELSMRIDLLEPENTPPKPFASVWKGL